MDSKITFVFLMIGVDHIVEPFGPRAGPYDIDITKIEACEKQGSGKVTFGTRITNAGKGKYLYKENFTFGVPMDEHFRENIEVQKWGNGGWRPKYMEHKLKNCEGIMKVVGDFVKSLMKSAGVTVDKCPVPAGVYKANDWLIELNLAKTVPVMEYGKYHIILQIFYQEEFVGCLHVYGESTPKALG